MSRWLTAPRPAPATQIPLAELGDASPPAPAEQPGRKILSMAFRRIARKVAIAPPSPSEPSRGDPGSVEGHEGVSAFRRCFENRDWIINPHSTLNFVSLFVVSLAYVYNVVAVPLRFSFPYQTPDNAKYWLAADGVCDIVYLLDMLLVKMRLTYLDDGIWVGDVKRTARHYTGSVQFPLDLVSVMPLENVFGSVGWRFVKALKGQSFFSFCALLDKKLSAPLISRVARTLIYTFYMIHLNACAYYKMSDILGIGSDGWVFSGEGDPYIRCFYFATKTSTSIGKLPRPESDVELVYMTFAWLTGVCAFALLVGQIRYFIMTGTKSETEYRKLLSDTVKCMRQLNVPCELQKKVTSWFDYTWKQQRTLDDDRVLDALPPNLRTELAIHMHMRVLSKVRLFDDCDEALLRDLVPKFRSMTYVPGDIICRKGDVGREMYILKSGEVEVLGGQNNEHVLATLAEGSVFGEISLLNIQGVNRRTADVRSSRFSNIFVLSKNDFNSVLAYYPDTQDLLMRKAKEMIRINAARENTDR